MLRSSGIFSLLFCFAAMALTPPETIHPDKQQFDRTVLAQYQAMVDALAVGDWQAVKEPGEAIASATSDWLARSDTHNRYYTNVRRLQSGAQAIAQVSKEEEAKARFAQLSKAALSYVNKNLPLKNAWNRFECKQVSGFNEWIQPATETKVKNPYLGPAGSQCANLKPWRRGIQ